MRAAGDGVLEGEAGDVALAGAQGEHKLARGYLPTTTHSLHWVGDPGFRAAIAEYLEAEADAVAHEIEVLTSYGPFRKTGTEDI